MPFWQFLRNWLIGWIGHALLVQPSISAHRKWPEMVASAFTNQVWTKITIKSYAWSFAIQIQIQTVCNALKLELLMNSIAVWQKFSKNWFPLTFFVVGKSRWLLNFFEEFQSTELDHYYYIFSYLFISHEQSPKILMLLISSPVIPLFELYSVRTKSPLWYLSGYSLSPHLI